MGADKLRAGILGASGYTGAELVRLLAHHPQVEIAALTAERRAGRELREVFPHLAGLRLPRLVTLAEASLDYLDLVFCCLPHGEAQSIVAALPRALRVIDLSADFRLADPASYARWYGKPHAAPELQREAVYGLTEIAREEVHRARLVANPGCYPVAAQLPLIPLLEAGLITGEGIVIDAKSGVSGAGRTPRETSLFAEVGEGVSAYGVGGHRHVPEIEQGLAAAAGRALRVSFTPHLVPMNRGILATIYVCLAAGAKAADLRQALVERYRDEPFVRLVPEGQAPATRHVRGSNLCLIGVFGDRAPGRAILVAAIDNLVKGASGLAVQNMNAMHGFAETTGLVQEPLFP